MFMEFDIGALEQASFATARVTDESLRIERCLAHIAAGGLVIVTDDKGRENEGDLIAAADRITPQSVAFMVNHTTGIICAALDDPTADRLGLPMMVEHNTDPHATAFTVTCDAVGTGTGVCAADRAATLRRLADRGAQAGDLRRPGHIFPLRARRAGLFSRPGHTEAAYDLARLAGCRPVGVLCELVNRDGTMMRGGDLERFAGDHGLEIVSIRDLIQWRLGHE